MPQVDGMGQFSIRGGILDIFPLTEEVPVRIELWDTEIDSIRTFDLESQRSIEQLDEILIYPATELVLTKKELLLGAERLRKEEKAFSEKLRKAMKTEEAHRIQSIVKELTEGMEEGWKITGLDSCVTYFSFNILVAYCFLLSPFFCFYILTTLVHLWIFLSYSFLIHLYF